MQQINLYSKEQIDDNIYTKSEIDTMFENIDVDLSDYYTKSEIDTMFENIDVDLSDYYTKSEIDTMFENIDVDLSDYYTKSEINTMLSNKADSSALSNYYTKTESNNLLNGKQNTLTAGTGISIVNNVISATGSGVEIIEITQFTYNNLSSELRAVIPDLRVGDIVCINARVINDSFISSFVLEYVSADNNVGTYQYSTYLKTPSQTNVFTFNDMRAGVVNQSINGVYQPCIIYHDHERTINTSTGQSTDSYYSPSNMEFVKVRIIRKVN